MGKRIQLDAAVHATLADAWEKCRIKFGGVPTTGDKADAALAAMKRFATHHTLATVPKVVSHLQQGFHVVLHALSWVQAAVGREPYAEARDTNKRLGEAWRLAVAYSGFERVVRALLNVNHLEKASFQLLVNAVNLPPYTVSIAPPLWRRGTRHSQAGGFESKLKAFLRGLPVADWVGSLELAKSIRHHTAHGSLTPKKVEQYALRRPIVLLTDELGGVVAAVADRLAEDV